MQNLATGIVVDCLLSESRQLDDISTTGGRVNPQTKKNQ